MPPSDEERRQRRAEVDRAEALKDLHEDYEAAKSAALAVGDRAEVDRLTGEMSDKRRQLRQAQIDAGDRDAGTGILASTSMWVHWARIAFEQEALAHAALDEFEVGKTQESDPLGRSFQSSLIVITSTAFMIESVFGSVCYLLPEQGDGKRWSTILRTFRAGFDLKPVERADQRVKDLFDLRDGIVHPWVVMRRSAVHPRIGNTSFEVAIWNPDAATLGLDVACDLLRCVAGRPLPGCRRAERWSREQGSSMKVLDARRRPAIPEA